MTTEKLTNPKHLYIDKFYQKQQKPGGKQKNDNKIPIHSNTNKSRRINKSNNTTRNRQKTNKRQRIHIYNRSKRITIN